MLFPVGIYNLRVCIVSFKNTLPFRITFVSIIEKSDTDLFCLFVVVIFYFRFLSKVFYFQNVNQNALIYFCSMKIH